MEERDAFLANAPKLKDAPKAWGKVFLKKDQHPVYMAENKRLRKKLYDLKRIESNNNKDIKLIEGKLSIDGIEIDRNSFFQ